MLKPLLLSLFILPAMLLRAQQSLSGRIYPGTGDSTLAGINIFNRTQKVSSLSAADGRYSIAAAEGDTVLFSGAGYENHLMVVEYYQLLIPQDINMKIDFRSLKPITVFSSYQRDSLERRNEYRRIFEQTPNITGGNRPSDGVGVSFSLFSFFSKKAKAQRKLKKKLLEQEQESYIDYSFPATLVANLTRLKGDSLRLFLYRFRPDYKFCRRTDRQGMILYINNCYKEFINPRNEKNKD